MKYLSVLLLAALFLTSCSSGDAGTQSEQSGETTALEVTSATETTAEIPTYEPLPEYDMEGNETVILVTKDPAAVKWDSMDFNHEGITGEPLNDAVYERNTAIEERYNTAIKVTGAVQPAKALRTAVTAGDDVYDICLEAISRASIIAQEGLLHNLYDLPYLDFSQDWWDQNLERSCSFGGKLFFQLGDINYLDNDTTYAIYFNKDLFEKYNVEFPYKAVLDGSWTLDMMYEISSKLSADLDGDGVINDNDQIGFLGETASTYYNFVGGGGVIADLDADGLPRLRLTEEKMYNIYDKAFNMMADSDSSLVAEHYTGKYKNAFLDCELAKFINGTGAMNGSWLKNLATFRDMEDDFGLLPPAKYSESQDEYYTPLSLGFSNAVSIPVIHSDPDTIALILEALARESVDTVTAAYFETCLERKYTRDNESNEMLKIILDSHMFDLGIVYNWGNYFNLIKSMTKEKTNTFASMLASTQESVLAEIAKTTEIILAENK